MVGSIPPPATNNMSEYKKSFCPLCLAECGILVKTDSNKIISIIPDKSNPVSRGYICERPQRFVNREDPLLETPLKRVAGTLVPITWEQAIFEIADKLKQYSGDDIFYFESIQTSEWPESLYLIKFLDSLGASAFTNIFGIEVANKFTTEYELLNKTKSIKIEADAHNTQTLMLVGKNMWVTNHEVDARKILSDIKRDPNRNLIVVDIVKTRTAELADYFVQIKPGTDFWFLRSLIKVMVDNNLINQSWLNENVDGLDNLSLVTDFDLKQYLTICGVSYDSVLEIAQVIFNSHSFTVKSELGINHTPNSMANFYFLNLLWVLVGSYNRMGAMNPLLMLSTRKYFSKIHRYTKYSKQRTAMGGSIPAAAVEHELPHYKVAIVNQSNPLNHVPNANTFTKLFSNLDLTVVMDCVLTETARLADYVLPTPSYYQKYDVLGFTTNKTQLQLKRPVKSKGNQRTVCEIVNNIAKYGLTNKQFEPWYKLTTTSTYETPILSIVEYVLADIYDKTFGTPELSRQHIKQLIETGYVQTQVESLPNNLKLNLNLDNLDKLLTDPDTTAVTKDKEYPLLLAAGYRKPESTGINFINNSRLVVEVSPVDAQLLAIESGETVQVSTRNGSLTAECVIDNDLQLGYIRMPTTKELNVLTSTNIKDRTNPMYKINHARIDKINKH